MHWPAMLKNAIKLITYTITVAIFHDLEVFFLLYFYDTTDFVSVLQSCISFELLIYIR